MVNFLTEEQILLPRMFVSGYKAFLEFHTLWHSFSLLFYLVKFLYSCVQSNLHIVIIDYWNVQMYLSRRSLNFIVCSAIRTAC